MKSSFVFRTPPLFCTFWWWASVGVWLNWMITSTVAPLWLPLRASRSFDSLCFLPSAKDNPAASRVISTKSAIRLPQVVVVFRTLSLEGRLVAYISWAPKTALRGQEGDKARCLAFFQRWKYQVWTKNESIVQGGPRCSTKVQAVFRRQGIVSAFRAVGTIRSP